MPEGMIILIVALIITAGIYLIRYVLNYIFDKGEDAVKNAIHKRKSKSHPPETENLSDRFK